MNQIDLNQTNDDDFLLTPKKSDHPGQSKKDLHLNNNESFDLDMKSEADDLDDKSVDYVPKSLDGKIAFFSTLEQR